tara:strand:+ start:158 stop:436 length:279 start_codon:yes stop_codon:yes gene_type:complete
MIDHKGSEVTTREMIRAHSYPLLAAIGTFSLVISSFTLIDASKTLKEASKSIEPISEWAKTQNNCVEKTFRINGKDTRGLSSKVWSCNGGGD